MNNSNNTLEIDSIDLVDEFPTILTRSGDTRPRWVPGERLHHLFEVVAEQRPDEIAIETEQGNISFGSLEAEANRLACLLIDQGLEAGDVVALMFDRNIEAYIALLAVLKIEAVYVPLDPKLPAERLQYITRDAGVSIVLTVAKYVDLANVAQLPVLSLDTLVEERSRYSSARVEPRIPTNDLAYIIYTSGSTGRPKGVKIQHHSIVNFVRVAAETYGYQPGDRVYQGLTLAFDFSVEEIWVPLLAGATLVPSQSGGSLMGEELHTFLAERKITALCCVPTLLATIDEELPDLPDLRLLIVSGEACPEEIVRRWHRDTRIILNAYGPTEATVTATVAVLRPSEPVTIGSPLPSYMIVILDPNGPAALRQGEVGEIGIAGIGLSPGYVGRDDLTGLAFIRDFLGLPDNPSGRIYRTGDLGRIDEAGQVEYHGRIDTQVKIRGYRIELTEIESVIMQRPGVVQAVVDTFEPRPGIKELVAYYTTNMHVTPEEVAHTLSQQLPTYMVPTYYECLESIVMLPSDKVDRNALPPPSGKRLIRGSADYVAPQGALESRLAELLAELLNMESVSVTHDFFGDLGANSLLMARFSARIRRDFQTNGISMREIYQAPTIRQLAAILNSHTEPLAREHDRQVLYDASYFAYWGTGAYQVIVSFCYAWVFFIIFIQGFQWCLAGGAGLEAYGRAAAFSAGLLVFMSVFPIAAKWLLIGRWRSGSFPIWGMTYARFWTVKTLVNTSPLAMIPGTPLYNAYLKALGARIDWSAVVLCSPPICTDLIHIGPQAVVGRGVKLMGYKAVDGRIVTGPVKVGARTYISDGAVLDINTQLEDDAELGHSSSMHEGQIARAGLSYHGTPAVVTSSRFRTLSPGHVSLIRRLGYSVAQLGTWSFGLGAVMIMIITFLYRPETASEPGQSPILGLPVDTITALPTLVGYSVAVFAGTIALGLAWVLVTPRLAWLFLRENKEYRLFGLRHYMLQVVTRSSNSRFFNLLFGDSSYIIYYLKALGYRFNGVRQSGSNFGVQQRHDVPFLCEFGLGTMVSDNLIMSNAEFSNTSFRLGRVRFGEDNYLGNEIIYPSRGKTGDNVLFGTMAMVPIDGETRENTGLLGSPVFEIPRKVVRDTKFDYYKEPDILAARLRLKNRSNLVTIGLFLAARLGLLVLLVVIGHALFFGLGLSSTFGLAVTSLLLSLVSIGYVVLIERLSYGFGDHEPQYCSIYDDYFWWHEKFWKLMVSTHLSLLNGTPFKGLVWRALNVRVGRKLYDEGCSISEKNLVTIGDNCTLNATTTIQAHSLEEGTFKSDHIVLGSGVTLGVKAFVHYGTTVGDNTLVEPHSFLMKGESTSLGSRWCGNPAA